MMADTKQGVRCWVNGCKETCKYTYEDDQAYYYTCPKHSMVHWKVKKEESRQIMIEPVLGIILGAFFGLAVIGLKMYDDRTKGCKC